MENAIEEEGQCPRTNQLRLTVVVGWNRSQARHYLMMLELTWATQVEISHFGWIFG